MNSCRLVRVRLVFPFWPDECASGTAPNDRACGAAAVEQTWSDVSLPEPPPGILTDRPMSPQADAAIRKMVEAACVRAELPVVDGGCEGRAARPAGPKPEVPSFR
jgi:hypothetical protein